MIIIFIEKPRYLLIGLLYADDENASLRNCNTIQMMDRNSLALGQMVKIDGAWSNVSGESGQICRNLSFRSSLWVPK